MSYKRGSDELLVIIGPDERRPEFSVIVVSTPELRSFRRFQVAALERTWPPRLISRAPWRTLLSPNPTPMPPRAATVPALPPIDRGLDIPTSHNRRPRNGGHAEIGFSHPNDPVTMRPDFKQKLESFFEGCKRIHTDYHATRGFENDAKWNMTWLKKYVRIEMSSSASTHVQCFIDIATGEVLKPAGWKRPAITKTKRGNIFDEHNGLRYFGPYGVSSVDSIKHGQF